MCVCVCVSVCLSVCATSLSIHPSMLSMDTGGFSVLAIVNNAAMKCGCRYLFEFVFSFSLDIFPELELLDHMVVLVLIFWGSYILFSIVAAPVYNPTNSACSWQHLFSLFFLRMAVLIGTKWYLICVFYISYGSIVDLQCCVSFRYTAKWFNYTYIYIHFFQILFP